jgi:hypothetical protein
MNVFLRDTCMGAAGCTPTTITIGVASDGSAPDSSCQFPSISADGRFVAFHSFATNLIPGGTSGIHAYVRDTCIGAPGGCTPSTLLVSVASDGTPLTSCPFGACGVQPAISADGRYVAFESRSSAVVAGDANGVEDIFVRDTCFGGPPGCVPSTVRVSLASDGSEGNGDSELAQISADGRFVAFQSFASNLVTGDLNGQNPDVFVRDRDADGDGFFDESGLGETATLRASLAADGSNIAHGFDPAISGNGRFVGFGSTDSNVVPGDTVPNSSDVFVRDTCVGAPAGCTPSTIWISVPVLPSTGFDCGGRRASLSSDGRFVSFVSCSDNFVPGDTNQVNDVFVRDTCIGAAGCTPSTVRVSIAADGTEGNFESGSLSGFGNRRMISADGRFVVFDSLATNLFPGATSFIFKIFLARTGF